MIALDANVLLYACDRADFRRQQIAIDLIATAATASCFGKWPASSSRLPAN